MEKPSISLLNSSVVMLLASCVVFWPLEASVCQPDIQKDESVPSPKESLDPVASGAAEQE